MFNPSPLRLKLLALTFNLPGCHSLKEKRQRLAGLKDRFGKKANLAVTESDFHDAHDQAEWCFVSVGIDAKDIERRLAKVEKYASEELDAVITGVDCRWI